MKHVYKPERLLVRKGCVSVTGIVVGRKAEDDGDLHMRLRIDPGQGRGWLNKKNATIQKGALVFEPLCIRTVKQKSAKKACKGFKQDLDIPANGTHVRTTGIHVLDNEPGYGWREIHPVTKTEVLSP